MKKWIALLLSAVMVLALTTGCSGTGNGGVKLDPKNPAAVIVWHYYNGALLNAFQASIKEFNETVGLEKGIIVESYGLGNVSELEAAVMAALRAAEESLTPAQVQGELASGLARTTVTTILSRLHEKGAVTRTRAGRGFAYTPTEDAPGLTARRMHSELRKEPDRGTVLARFVSQLSDEDERLLRELLDGEQR